MTKVHDVPFKGASRVKEQYFAYPYMPQNPEVRISRRMEANEVYTSPRNFVTKPSKKGNPNSTPGLLLSKEPEYLPDEYERNKRLENIERKANEAKIIEEPFKCLHYGGNPFASDRLAFGREESAPVPDQKPATTRGLGHS
jgi:hypothetical protein